MSNIYYIVIRYQHDVTPVKSKHFALFTSNITGKYILMIVRCNYACHLIDVVFTVFSHWDLIKYRQSYVALYSLLQVI